MNMQSINITAKIVIYSHDTMGLGHMRRNLLIATALAKSHLKASVLLISGTHQLSELDLPAGVDLLTLPVISKSISGTYTSRQYDLPLNDIIRLRSQIIETAVKAFEPNVFIADNVPRGVGFELDSVLNFLSNKAEILRILGIRDILDDAKATRKEWIKNQNEKIIQRYYDVVWVYGDQNFFDTSEEYGFSEQLKQKLTFIGYLNPLCRHNVKLISHKQLKRKKKQNLPDSFHLCMVGGGQDGIALTQAFADALEDSEHNGVILTGPFLSDKAFKKLEKRVNGIKNITLIKFYHEPINLIKMADRVISMGGYNSISEILALKKTALIIPRIKPRQEQLIRANKLSAWGLIDVMHPDTVNADEIKLWLNNDQEKHIKTKTLDFGGLNRIVDHIDEYHNITSSESVFLKYGS